MDYDQHICFFYLLYPVICTVLVALLIYLFWWKLRQLVRSEETFTEPPGPFALPIVGNISLLGSQPNLNLTHLADLYGEIYTLCLGSRKVVVLNSVKIAREVLVKNARHFSDRPPLQSFQVNSNNGQSIAFGNAGQWYSYHKKFASRALSKMYKNGERFHQIASDEMTNLKRNLLRLDQSNEPIDPTSLIKDLVFKFSFRFMFGDDVPGTLAEDFYRIIIGQSATFVENNSAVNLVDFFPWLAALFKNQTRKIKSSVDQLMDFVKLIYEVHTTKGDDINQCITEALKGEALTAQTLSEDSMVQILADLFGGGLEKVSTSMIWAVAFLASNKPLQDKLYDELQGVIGESSNRSPSLEDKFKMPLLQATVLELLRMSSVLPLGMPHYCSQDAMISGYKVSKGTVVLLNLWAINHDPNSFEEPNIFNPYRFLDPVTHQLVTDDWMLALPFSTGTRKCPGATVAKSKLFLLVAGLLHNFSFEMAGEKVNLNGTFGLTLRPHPFSMYIHERF